MKRTKQRKKRDALDDQGLADAGSGALILYDLHKLGLVRLRPGNTINRPKIEQQLAELAEKGIVPDEGRAIVWGEILALEMVEGVADPESPGLREAL